MHLCESCVSALGTGDTLAVLGLLELSWRYLQWGTKPGLTIARMVGLEVPHHYWRNLVPPALASLCLRAYFFPSIKGTHMLLPNLEEIDFLIWLPWGDRPYWDC